MEVQLVCTAQEVTHITSALRIFVERGLLAHLTDEDHKTLSRALSTSSALVAQATTQVKEKTANIKAQIEAAKAGR
jgi:hypothetical protein